MIRISGYLSIIYVALLLSLLTFDLSEFHSEQNWARLIVISIVPILIVQVYYVIVALKWLRLPVLNHVKASKVLDQGVLSKMPETLNKPWYLWFFSFINIALGLIIVLVMSVMAFDGFFSNDHVNDDSAFQLRRLLLSIAGILVPFLIYFNLKTLMTRFIVESE